MATEQGANQAWEVGELMSHTVTKLEHSILAVQQQKSAADQVDGAVVQIRDAADQLAAEQAKRASTAERLEALAVEIEAALRDRVAAPAPQVNGSVPPRPAAGAPPDVSLSATAVAAAHGIHRRSET
jgi:S-methylmethionine-dependent homocysteine/selenocysteine methylase